MPPNRAFTLWTQPLNDLQRVASTERLRFGITLASVLWLQSTNTGVVLLTDMFPEFQMERRGD